MSNNKKMAYAENHSRFRHTPFSCQKHDTQKKETRKLQVSSCQSNT